VRPVGEQWQQLADFFGPSGAYSGCWCTWWRQTSGEFAAGCTNGAVGNRAVLQGLTSDGRGPGLLAYDAVWAVPCFWVPRAHRGKGVATALIAAAVDHARNSGASVLEGFPLVTDGRASPAAILTGTLSNFLKAGFTEVQPRRSGTRVVVRLILR
jgi:GNAT superfamily N-acetyltransferase